MTVYVDDMRRPTKVPGARPAKWSHLFADTQAELDVFAVGQLGLSSRWLQHAGGHREHYDVTDTVRTKAVALGAVEISYPRGTAELLARRKATCDCAEKGCYR
jgi:hypothetical protein